jgi:hypothetical protein
MKAKAVSVAKAARALPVLVYYATVLRRTLTYGDLGDITADHPHSFKPAFAQIHEWVGQSAALHGFEKLPLAIIVVQQGKSTPGAGAIRWRLEANHLSENSTPDVIEAMFEREHRRIFEFKHWNTVLADQKIAPYEPRTTSIESITNALKKRGAPKGESEAHRSLKKYVGANPTSIALPRGTKLVDYEVVLPSLDRVDILFRNADTIFPIEIKSHEVDELEFTRGVYQTVKYRSLFEAYEMDCGSSNKVEARLVCGRPASKGERLRCQLLGVPLCANVRPR